MKYISSHTTTHFEHWNQLLCVLRWPCAVDRMLKSNYQLTSLTLKINIKKSLFFSFWKLSKYRDLCIYISILQIPVQILMYFHPCNANIKKMKLSTPAPRLGRPAMVTGHCAQHSWPAVDRACSFPRQWAPPPAHEAPVSPQGPLSAASAPWRHVCSGTLSLASPSRCRPLLSCHASDLVKEGSIKGVNLTSLAYKGPLYVCLSLIFELK